MRRFTWRPIEHCSEMIGECLDATRRLEHDLAAVLEHLHRGADADRHHKRDDENRNGTA